MKVNVVCKKIDEKGRGIVYVNKKPVVVDYLLKDEEAIIEITKKQVKLLSIVKPSPYRQKPPCIYYYKCGGCQLQHINDIGQHAFKQEKVQNELGKYNEIQPIITMKEPYFYRNKSHFTFQRNKQRKIIAGMYEENSHKIVNVDQCIIQDDVTNKINQTIKNMLPSFKIEPYNEDTKAGFLRHVLIRVGYKTREVMVVLVTSSIIFPSKKNFIKALLKSHPEITTIVLNINNKKTSMILGSKQQKLYGKGFIEDELNGFRFKISPSSFYQINPLQTEILYKKAIEMAQIDKKDVVLDAYCGTGTIGIFASQYAKSIIGVELNKHAINDAIMNAKNNNISNIYFVQGDASDVMMQYANENKRIDVVILDPPRSGTTNTFISAVATLKPKKVVYVSCEVKTLARDLEDFVKNGYEVKHIQPVDMFAQTFHTECVVLLRATID